MTIWEFVLTPIDEQAQYVKEYGSYLMHKEGQWTTINLYALHNFYVEIWIDRGRNSITRIAAFENVTRLDSYLNGISLDGLL